MILHSTTATYSEFGQRARETRRARIGVILLATIVATLGLLNQVASAA